MNKIKRIIFVGRYTPGDASSNFVISFCKGYRELGLEVSLVVNVDNIELLPDLQGIDVHPVLRKNGPLGAGIEREREVYRIVKHLYKKGESVVQFYNSPTYGIFHRKNAYPRFDTLGEVPFADPSTPWIGKLKEWLQLIASKTAKGLLVQTNYLRDYFQNYGVNKDNICVFNILIDPKRFEHLPNKSAAQTISYCGKVGLYKDGVNDLITAFSRVHKKHPNSKLRIIGGFASDYDEKILRQTVEELAISDCVEFTGRVFPEEMPALLYNSTILALARPNNKQAKYGFPSKLGEYLFTGNPVVVTRVGEIDNFLKDRVSCLFANPDDPKDFAEKLDWALSNPDEAKKIGLAGRKVAEENFSIQSQCKVALDFFEKALLNKTS